MMWTRNEGWIVTPQNPGERNHDYTSVQSILRLGANKPQNLITFWNGVVITQFD
ncbi:hypothetical protein C8R31_104258 [Nitrosospira sp. Nsp2]|nr:hypothetical protein C8R31_104258 [Nitrosospira sp. Nsp2]